MKINKKGDVKMGIARPLYPGEKNASPNVKLRRTLWQKIKRALKKKRLRALTKTR